MSSIVFVRFEDEGIRKVKNSQCSLIIFERKGEAGRCFLVCRESVLLPTIFKKATRQRNAPAGLKVYAYSQSANKLREKLTKKGITFVDEFQDM